MCVRVRFHILKKHARYINIYLYIFDSSLATATNTYIAGIRKMIALVHRLIGAAAEYRVQKNCLLYHIIL